MQKGTPTYILTRVAILVAISTVIKVVFSLTAPTFRFTFYEIPLMILGLMFGPLMGGIGGFVGDVINIIVPNFATNFNLFTVSAIVWGVIPGLFLYKRENLSLVRISLVVLGTALVAFTLNTTQLYLWYGVGVFGDLPLRIATLIVKLPIQIGVIEILYRRVLVHELKLLKSR